MPSCGTSSHPSDVGQVASEYSLHGLGFSPLHAFQKQLLPARHASGDVKRLQGVVHLSLAHTQPRIAPRQASLSENISQTGRHLSALRTQVAAGQVPFTSKAVHP